MTRPSSVPSSVRSAPQAARQPNGWADASSPIFQNSLQQTQSAVSLTPSENKLQVRLLRCNEAVDCYLSNRSWYQRAATAAKFVESKEGGAFTSSLSEVKLSSQLSYFSKSVGSPLPRVYITKPGNEGNFSNSARACVNGRTVRGTVQGDTSRR